MAAGYHQLGTLAQLRGDYNEADTRYRQALDIKERLGDQPGIATTYSALGALAAELNDPAAAVTWNTRALAIRQRLQIPDGVISLRRLDELREALSRADFDSAALSALADSDLPNLHQLIDEFRNQVAALDDDPSTGDSAGA